MHGDSLPMLSPLGLSNRKPLPLGMGYITAYELMCKANASYDRKNRAWEFDDVGQGE